LLIKRTHIALVVGAAIVFPAAAIAASDGNPAMPQIGISAAKAVGPTASGWPIDRFHRTVRVVVRRMRAERRAELRERRRRLFASLPEGVSLETLEAIAACESGGDPTVVSSDGSYRGKYQFSFETWASVGGSGDPAAASEAEQDYRAALLYSQSGSSPWPVCG
jgi:transglycosylase-like protein